MELKLGNIVKTLVEKKENQYETGLIIIPKGTIGVVMEPFDDGAIVEFEESESYPPCLIAFDNEELEIIE